MWPSVKTTRLLGLLCVLQVAVSTASENRLYKKVGDEVVLKPDAAFTTITSIMWKDGPNIAIQWDGEDIVYYRQFRERGKLNISSGELTITGLTRNDTGLYTPEINNKVYSSVDLIVISPVPTPTLSESCDKEKTTCTLTCNGDTAGAEPVAYNWKFDDSLRTTSSKTYTITKENSLSIKEFSCELQNQVSKESSEMLPNPLISTPSDTEGGLKINTGLTVFICLLTAIMLLSLIHRWKAGMWFFQKGSMPWEADFWRKERQRTDAADSNGTAAFQRKTQTDDEETPMT